MIIVSLKNSKVAITSRTAMQEHPIFNLYTLFDPRFLPSYHWQFCFPTYTSFRFDEYPAGVPKRNNITGPSVLTWPTESPTSAYLMQQKVAIMFDQILYKLLAPHKEALSLSTFLNYTT